MKKIIPNFLRKPIKKGYLYIFFLKDFITFKKMAGQNSRFALLWKNRYPQLFDNTKNTNFDTHYLYHPAWAARIVKQIDPEFHIDISSTLTFSTILSAFIPVKFYDYRKTNVILSNLTSEGADLTKLPFANESVNSLSCMHTIEHIGLGRYGDMIDPDGDLRVILELKRILAREGNLLFVVPIGKAKIMFNAHRIYSYDQILNYFSDLKLQEFSLIPDNATEIGMIHNASKEMSDKQRYGCGCFWFKK